MPDSARTVFWSRTKRITAALLALWTVVNLALPWFARDLHALSAFGFPLGFWLAAEGALVVYLAIIVVYAVAMDRLEARYLAGDDSATSTPGPAAASAAADRDADVAGRA